MINFPGKSRSCNTGCPGNPCPKATRFRKSLPNRRDRRRPEMWILGSSDYGAQLAAYFGLPYAFAYFFSDGFGVEQALDLYRKNYRPSENNPKPICTICVWALAADTEAGSPVPVQIPRTRHDRS